MISAFFDFCKSEAWPRRRDLVVSTEIAIAAVLGVLFGLFGVDLAVADTATGDVVIALLAYAAIGFGFSVAGLTLVLTAPDHDFAADLAWSDPAATGLAQAPPKTNSYSNLLFIFSWTAIAHWAVVVASFALLLALGRSAGLMPDGSSIRHRVAVGLVVFVTVYAVELFLVTVITLAQVGQTYIERLHRSKPNP